MARLDIKSMPTRKKIIPLVMAVGNVIMKKLGFVEKINEAVEWDKARWNISPGSLLKMLVMGTFTDIRIPLTHLEDRFENIDIEFFLEYEDKSGFVNSSNVGEALERLGNADYEAIYETIALSALQIYNIPITRMHSDTTTISFYGEYDPDRMHLTEDDEEELLKIERGYNKDGRPECKQVVVGQITNEYGIPIVSRTKDGSTSDIEWNREAIQYVERIRDAGFEKGVYIADSKLIIEEFVTAMNDADKRINFVSRCPANFYKKLESRMIEKAYENGQWKKLGQFCDAKDATQYKGISFIEDVCGAQMRLLALESDTLKRKAFRAFAKKEAELIPLIKALEKKQWLCLADAEKERDRFLAMKQLKLFECDIEIEKRVREKWPKGRRGANTRPQYKETYHICVKKTSKAECAYQEFMHRESCIVIISNVIENMSDEDLLKTYKGQQVVENSFRMLKSPQVASVIYLKNPARIQALSMLLTFSLLVRALIQYKLRDGLKKFEEEYPRQKIYAGWGGRPLRNPTFKLFYEHTINCCFERENWKHYSFAWPSIETKKRVAPLLELMGISLVELLQ